MNSEPNNELSPPDKFDEPTNELNPSNKPDDLDELIKLRQENEILKMTIIELRAQLASALRIMHQNEERK